MRLIPATAFCATAVLSLSLLLTATARAEALSRADYAAHRRQIDADFRSDRSDCERRTGHDRSVCLVKAQGRQKVALAELDYNASGKESDAARLALVKVDFDYAVAKERCDVLPARVEREQCMARAEAERSRASSPPRSAPLRRF